MITIPVFDSYAGEKAWNYYYLLFLKIEPSTYIPGSRDLEVKSFTEDTICNMGVHQGRHLEAGTKWTFSPFHPNDQQTKSSEFIVNEGTEDSIVHSNAPIIKFTSSIINRTPEVAPQDFHYETWWKKAEFANDLHH